MISLDQKTLAEVTDYQLGPVGTTWTNLYYKGQYTRKGTVEAIETVTVPAGTHRVELLYAPASFRLGLGVAAASLLVLLGLLRRAHGPSTQLYQS